MEFNIIAFVNDTACNITITENIKNIENRYYFIKTNQFNKHLKIYCQLLKIQNEFFKLCAF